MLLRYVSVLAVLELGLVLLLCPSVLPVELELADEDAGLLYVLPVEPAAAPLALREPEALVDD